MIAVKTKDAIGFYIAQDSVRISATMSATMFDHLKWRACKEKKSIAAKMREYIEAGLEVDLDWDEDLADQVQHDQRTTTLDEQETQ